MEISEAGRRIFQLHWRLIALCVVVSVSVLALVALTRTTTYTSSARIILDTPDPQSVAEATANADLARALATSADQVDTALAQVGVRRDAIKLAKKDINVQPIGSSGVLKLLVTDTNPRVAADLANALATQVIATRLRVSRGQYALALPQLEQRIKSLDSNIQTLRAELASLDARIAAARNAATIQALTQTRDETSTVLDFLTTERAGLEQQRGLVLTPDALGPDPSIIQIASQPIKADPSAVPQLLGLALLLGLVVGIGAAASIETLHPSLVGNVAVANALAVFPIADIGAKKSRTRGIGLAAERILLAADSAGARTIELLPIAPGPDIESLADGLEWDLKMLRFNHSAHAQDEHATSTTYHEIANTVRVFNYAHSARNAAIVLVAPGRVRLSAVNDALSLVRIVKKPVLGLITDRSGPKSEVFESVSTQSPAPTQTSEPELGPAIEEDEANSAEESPQSKEKQVSVNGDAAEESRAHPMESPSSGVLGEGYGG